MKENLNTKQGISLIVLVITIIVIIILAVAVILTLANNNPIENAHRAVNDNNEATLKEEATLLYADWYTQSTLGTLDPNYKDKAQDYVKDKLSDGYTQELIDKLTVSNTGEITIGEESVVAKNPVIPNGFEYKEGTVDNGYVIKNITDGNEFVWVPVEKGTFVRESFKDTPLDKSVYIEPSEKNGYGEEYTQEVDEYNAILESVEKYGGFYIARYEASIANGIPQSLQDKEVWLPNYCGEAENAVRCLYPVEEAETGDVVSTLTYGVQWDATVRFLLKNYSREEITQDSTELGNYNPSAGIKTGNNSTYMLNNIYDMGGNYGELTLERYSSYSNIVVRGGAFWSKNAGEECTISARKTGFWGNFLDPSAVRIALYIK